MAIAENNVSYSSKLIDDLLQDHRHIFSLLEQIKSALIQHKYQQVARLLGKLRSTAIVHVSRENLKLYVYLQNYYRDSIKEYKMLRKIRKYANAAEAQLLTFIEENQDIATNLQKQECILSIFEQLYSTLKKKKLTEEKEAFPLYKPPAFNWGP